MGTLRSLTAKDTHVTLIEFIESVVVRLRKESEYEELRHVSQTKYEEYYLEGRTSPSRRPIPDEKWPRRQELTAQVQRMFLKVVEAQGWEVRSHPGDRQLLLRELKECTLDIYAANLNRGNTIHFTVHLIRKTVDFESSLIEQFEIECARTPPGQFTLDQIFDNMLKRCNLSNGIREETRSRIKKLAVYDPAHSKTGPRPNISRTS